MQALGTLLGDFWPISNLPKRVAALRILVLGDEAGLIPVENASEEIAERWFIATAVMTKDSHSLMVARTPTNSELPRRNVHILKDGMPARLQPECPIHNGYSSRVDRCDGEPRTYRKRRRRRPELQKAFIGVAATVLSYSV
jgi:hypothetical protein